MTRLQIQELIVSVIVNKTEPNTITPVMVGNLLTLINDEVFTGRTGLFVYTKVDINNYTILPADCVLSVNNGAVDWDILLPSAVGVSGKQYIIKRFDNTSTGAVNITATDSLVQASNGAFGAATLGIWETTAGASIVFQSNGTNWEYIK